MKVARGLLFAALAVLGVSCAEAPPRSDETSKGARLQPVASEKLLINASNARQVEVSLFYPAEGCRQCTLILFSHGAASTPGRYSVLINAWVQAGYIVGGPLHVDSEEYADRENFDPSQYLSLRMEDVETALTALLKDTAVGADISFNGDYVAAGHSFGGLVAQIVGGARPHKKSGAGPANLTKKPDVIVAVSPPPTIPDYIDADGWSAVEAPMLVITGTKDVLPGFVEKWETHLDSYEAAPALYAYGAVFEDMDHYFNGAFGRVAAERQEDAVVAVDRLNDMILGFIDDVSGTGAPVIDQWAAQSDSIATTLTRAYEVEKDDNS